MELMSPQAIVTLFGREATKKLADDIIKFLAQPEPKEEKPAEEPKAKPSEEKPAKSKTKAKEEPKPKEEPEKED